MRGRDYRVVNKATWEAFLRLYGGGPTIPAKEFESQLKATSGSINVAFESSETPFLAPPPPPPTLVPPPPAMPPPAPPEEERPSESGESLQEAFREGYLFKAKQMGSFGWNKRYFVLKGNRFAWLKGHTVMF